MGTSGSRDKSDFSQGSIIANIVRMAIPMTLAVLVNALYNIVDRIYLGHIPGAGAYALTGVGLAFPVITVITAFQNLFGNGGAPLFAMARGEGNDDLASRYMSNVAFMLIVMGISLTIIAFLVKKDVLWLIGASEATFSFANDYLDVYLLGTVFVMMAIGLDSQYLSADIAVLANGRDIVKLPGDEVIDTLERSWRDVGAEDTLIITRSNKMTNLYNQGVRAKIMWKEDLPD